MKKSNLTSSTGSKVTIDGKEVGRVTKATYGYTEEMNIGYVVMDKDFADIGQKIEIVSNGKHVGAVLTRKIF